MCRQLKQGLNFAQPQGLSLNPHPLFRSFKERHLKSYSVSWILFDFFFTNGSYSQSCAREFKVICTISCLKRLALQMRSQTRRKQTSIVILQGLGTEFLGGLERPIENWNGGRETHFGDLRWRVQFALLASRDRFCSSSKFSWSCDFSSCIRNSQILLRVNFIFADNSAFEGCLNVFFAFHLSS